MTAGQLAVTVIGHDRPGIIADVTGALAEVGGNLEDSTMTILRGHFAMTLIVSTNAAAAEVESLLGPLAEGGGLTVSVRSVAPEPEVPARGSQWVLSVHGADRPGIVSAVTRVVAGSGGNITDLTTRLSGDLYLLVAEVDLPASADAAALEEALRRTAGGLGVDVSLRPAETDVL
jgi:glycine cleavage system transcriptional repressor